jgi:hypothetical protein
MTNDIYESRVRSCEARTDERRRLEQFFADEEYARRDGYCDYCEQTGHTFRTCAERDDSGYEEEFDQSDPEY